MIGSFFTLVTDIIQEFGINKKAYRINVLLSFQKNKFFIEKTIKNIPLKKVVFSLYNKKKMIKF